MITAEQLCDWKACWPDADIRAHLAGRPAVSPREVAADTTISLDDRLWVLCRALWYRDEAAARDYAIDSAALVSHLAGRPEDQAEHARLLVDLRRIYALPADQRAAELRRWGAAAWTVAWDAAQDPTWKATWGAAWGAAQDAAQDPTWKATWAAARGAAWGAAQDAAQDPTWKATWAAARGAAWGAAWAVALQQAIDRALLALGPDADGWTAGGAT